MSDSQFVQSAEPVASQFDVTLDLERIDRNIQTISTIERTWSQPGLPDEVKGDLASLPGVTEAGLLGFLSGVDEAFRERPEPEPIPDGMPVQNSGLDQAQIIVNSLSGNPAPMATSGDAIRRFKQDAIRAGLLDMDPSKVDSTWNPEFNRLRNDLMFDQYDDRLRGDREGAMPLTGAMKLLNDFTSPSGLLSAATQLDLWWDVGAINEERRKWGDKWRELGESDNPIEWAGNLWDALTGPLDDIILPAVNIALMFTGVGSIANTGRIGLLVGRGARSVDAFSDLYRGTRLARAATNFDELGRASGLATRLGRAENGLARASGNALKAWRANTATRVVKGTVQPIMRMGFVSNLEDRMGSFQGGTSLADVSDPVQEVSERLYMAGQSPITVLPELLIAPYNIFVPGTFIRRAGQGTGLVSRTGRAAITAGGTVGGRAAVGAGLGAAAGTVTGEDAGDIAKGAAIGAGAAALAPRVGGLLTKQHVPGAIKAAAVGAGAGLLLGDDPEDAGWGALAGVGIFGVSPQVRRIMTERVPFINKVVAGTGTGLGLLSFKPIVETQEYSIAMHRGMVSSFESAIANAPTAEEAQALRGRLNRWHTNVKLSGVNKALQDELQVSGELGEEVAASVVGWTHMSAMIDHIATTQATSMKGPWRGRYLMARNKLINQLRPFDLSAPTEDVLDDLASALAMTSYAGRKSRRGLAAETAKIRAKLAKDPAWAQEMANDHNAKALETMHQLWDPKNLPKQADDTFGPSQALPGEQSFQSTNMEGRAVLMEQYMPQMWDTFGNWPKFTSALDSIRSARASGLLDPAELAPAYSRSGRRSSITDVARRERQVDEANDALLDVTLQRKDPAKMADSQLTPAASSVLPGRFTVDRIGTKDGQELFELRERVEDLGEARKHLARLEGLGWRKKLVGGGPEPADPLLPGRPAPAAPPEVFELKDATRGQIGVLLRNFFPGKDAEKSLRYIVAFAKRKGLSVDELTGFIEGEAMRLADDAKLWGEYGMAERVIDENGRVLRGFDALAQRSKDLQERIPYTAKRVDVEALARSYEQPTAHAGKKYHDFTPGFDAPDVGTRATAMNMFNQLGDDDLVVVYHRTSKENAARLVASGAADPTMARSANPLAKGGDLNQPGDLYVHGSFNGNAGNAAGGQYGDTAVAITVRKGDLAIAPENSIGVMGAKEVGSGLLSPNGSVLKPGARWLEAKVVSKPVGSGKFASDGPGIEKARQVRDLAAQLERDGYKLVHGVEYLMPEDLAQLKPFADINQRHLNYATLGNHFKGRLPVEGHIVADLRHRGALVNELTQLKGSALSDVTVQDERIDRILDLAKRWLRDEQDRTEQLTRHMDVQTRTSRTLSRLKSSATPVNIEDVQQRGGEITKFLKGLGEYSDDEIKAIVRATAHFRNTSFRDLGLYAFEAKARSGNQAAWALKLLSGSNYGESFMRRGRGHRFVGTFAGAAVGRGSADEDDSFEEKLGKVALGALGGAAVGTVTPNLARAAGVDTLAARARDWRYGYMADGLARMRDSLRFTLSPIFDASRFTEGYMLGQTGAPLRKADGSRVVLPFNMSPRKLKRDIGREAYDARISQFQKFARDHQDFDPEVLDSAGRWFKQVGILGFSPVDWMGTAFARLLGEGFTPAEAYDASRRMYTYATGKGVGRARSAAEMSVNYVMFPFSFQKKALTGLGRWMNDDLGRSIMIHDALKTYEILDEEHDLEERWRDYFPWMQQLQRLNLFAYGLSAGRLGGVNSQLFESGGKMAWNMFVPVGLKIQDVEAGTELFGTPEQREAGRFGGVMGNLVPVWNDINWMIQNVTDTGHVLMADSHVTRAAERRKGWEKWNEFKSTFDEQLRAKGYTLEDLRSKPWLSEALNHYEDTKVTLAEQFPEWAKSRQESVSDIQIINADREMALDRFARDTRVGVTPMMDDMMIAEFESYLGEVRKQLSLTAGIDSLTDAPPAVFDDIIRRSVEYSQRNPRWRSIWGRFYEKELGPIEVTREL
jgi:hypothetical protein